ncbi:MAG: xanthine dehydrogenase family protein molybdopterin-binding subunit [Deltaproteobacteria bacterium]|nr:xanthine dehydrogenase family protein molybdopterin-binding subunit [Deltaproteobacteria bacterium]
MTLTRRGFFVGTGAAFALYPLYARAHVVPPPPPWQANPWISIDDKGTVTIMSHRSEMGQGVRSTLPVLIADELGADPKHITVQQAWGDEQFGNQDTDGSSSVRIPFLALREAAATARMMLITAAAAHWKVPEKRLDVRDSKIWDGAKALGGFVELVHEVKSVPVPKKPKLRALKELKYVGKELPQRDAEDVVDGVALFAADGLGWNEPGPLTAVIAHPPVLFAKPTKIDSSEALKVKGVRRVIELPAPKPPIGFQALGGVAVVADNTWAAMKGRKALRIEWDRGPNAGHDTAAYTEELRASVKRAGAQMRNVGDVDAALAKAATKVEAEYTGAYLAHAAMEPPAAIADADQGSATVYACTQSPVGMRDEIAKALGLDKQKVRVNVTLLGGGFGRKSFPDFGIEAALLAREMKQRVRVQWTREDDLQHGSFHTTSVQALAAALDDKGKVTAWRHRIAYPSIDSTFDPAADKPSDGEVGMGATDLPLAVPNVRVEACKATAHMRIGWLRSVCNIPQAFAVHSFLDEIAHAAKRDPRDVMVETFGPARVLTAKELGVPKLADNYGSPLDKTPFDVARLHRVIDKVSDMAGWNRRGGRALGMAAHSSFASWVAVVASVEKGPRGELRVDEAWIAADCGYVVNPDRVRYQMEGAFLFGLSNALHGAITVKDGAVVQTNFRDYRLLRITEAPRKIHVELIASDAHPGGAGEPGTPPVAPAVANAWFALTGTRLRSMPFA